MLRRAASLSRNVNCRLHRCRSNQSPDAPLLARPDRAPARNTKRVRIPRPWALGPIFVAPPPLYSENAAAITALLGMFISNTATAVLMAPVALAVAKEMHV